MKLPSFIITWRTACGRDHLHPTTLFNPFNGMYDGSYRQNWKTKVLAAFRYKVWRIFFQNLRYEFIDRPRWRNKDKDTQSK